MVEVGSRSIALHTLPKEVMNLAFCESAVGYAFSKITEGRF